MKRSHAQHEFETVFVENLNEGWGGLDLYRTGIDGKKHVARLIFWDADGQFSAETFGEVPLTILEDAIQEVKAAVRTS